MEDSILACQQLLQKGVLHFMQGITLGIDSTLVIKGPEKYFLKTGSRIRVPRKGQKERLKKLFAKTKTTPSEREEIVIVEEDVAFTSVTEAAFFVFGHSPAGNGPFWWNLKQDYLQSEEVFKMITQISTVQNLPRMFLAILNQVCKSCLISFVNEIPKYCKTEQEVVHGAMGCIKLQHQYFRVYRNLQGYVDLKQCTYFSMIDTLQESFLNEKMYNTFVQQKDEQMQKSFMTTLQQMENEPVFTAVEYIYDTFVELEKRAVEQEKRAAELRDEMKKNEPGEKFKRYLIAAVNWFTHSNKQKDYVIIKQKDE